MSVKQKLIVILGPTASGKTELSLKLAKKYGGYIISTDSRQIYKEMNIGTGKINGKWKNVNNKSIHFVDSIPHFMIDFLKPNERYSLADWQKQVKKILSSKIADTRYRMPIIVGGTGLYISSIVDNYDLPKGKVDNNIRKKLEKKNLTDLQTDLKNLDPDSFTVIDLNNKRRILRALEYVMINNKSYVKNIKKTSSKYDILQIGLQVKRENLYKRINKRVDKMIKAGLIAEVENLLKKYSPNLPAMSGIGYQQIIKYLHGDIDKESAIELIKRDSRHYAKRQMTWFKRDKRINWIGNYTQAEKLVKNFIKK